MIAEHVAHRCLVKEAGDCHDGQETHRRATALVVGIAPATATASFAQAVYYGGLYDYGYGYGQGMYYGAPVAPNWMRGGPGPRVGDGSGLGIGAER